MKVCNQCNKSWPVEFNLCPVCGSELRLDKPEAVDSISMGDGNAISGGINISKDFSSRDDHSVSSSHNVSNSNNKTTNISSHHIYHGNYTHVEREKTREEILIEHKQQFRKCCKEVLHDGLLTREERIWLEEQRSKLNLSAEMADHILKEVTSTHQHDVMSMGTVQRIQFNNFKRSVEGNMVDNVRKYMPQIRVIASKFQEEELQFLYHLALAALEPEECVEIYKNRQEDKYWLTFWVYVALRKLGDVQNAENALIDLGRWQGLMPDENMVILGAFGSLIENDKETANELFSYALTGESSPLLNNLVEVMSALINYHPDDADVMTVLTKHKFYVTHFFDTAYKNEVNLLKAKEEAERKKKEEEARRKAEEEDRRIAEEKRKEEEERIRIEHEELARKKAEEEARRQAEEEAKHIAEEKRRAEAEEEERRKAAEEARRKAEEEMRRKIEEEKIRKEKEEEELRRKEREEQRKKEEAERVRKEREELACRKAAEEARRKAEEELRRKIEEEKKRFQEEADRKAKEAAEEERRRKLDEYQAEAKRKAEELRKAEEEAQRRPRYCNKCGKQIPFGAVFCKSCGTKAPAQPNQTQNIASRICPKCGNSAELSAKFCKKCGSKF